MSDKSYYSIQLRVTSKSSDDFTIPFYFHHASNFDYQLKFLTTISARPIESPLPEPHKILTISHLMKDNTLKSAFLSETINLVTKLDSKFQDAMPYLADFEIDERESIHKLYSEENNKLSFYNYAKGQLYEYGIHVEQDFQQARQNYEEGIERKELACYLKMIRINIEPGFAFEFSQTTSMKRGVKLFLHAFINFGLFDEYSFSKPSLKVIHLFYVYLDLYPEFKDLVLELASDPSIWEDLAPEIIADDREVLIELLKILIEKNKYSTEAIEAFHRIINLSKNDNLLCNFILSELLDPSLYGVSPTLEFEKRVALYTKVADKGHFFGIWRAAYLYESMEKYQKSKSHLQESHKSRIEAYYKAAADNQGVEYIRRLANERFLKKNFLSKLPEIFKLHEYLYTLNDQKSYGNFFRLLKHQKDPRAFKIAKIMKENKIGFYEFFWAFCHEKGLGVKANLTLAIETYYEALNKLIKAAPEDPKNLILKRLGAAIKKTDKIEFSEFYYRLAAYEILSNVREKPLDKGNLLDFGKLMISGKGITSDKELGLSVLAYVQNQPIKSLIDPFLKLNASRKFKDIDINKIKPIIPDNVTDDAQKTKIIIDIIDKIEADIPSKMDIKKISENGSLKMMIQENLKKVLETEKPAALSENRGSQVDLDRIETEALEKSLMVRSPTQDLKISLVSRSNAIKAFRKSGTLKTSFPLNERVLGLLEYHKQKNYVAYSNLVRSSEKSQNLIAFMKALLLEYEEAESTEIKHKIKQKLTDALSLYVKEINEKSKVRYFKDEEYIFAKDSSSEKSSVVMNSNAQRFDLKILNYNLVYFVNILVESPGIFILPLKFSNPNFFNIYGYSFYNDAGVVRISYFMEPQKTTLHEHLAKNIKTLTLEEKLVYAKKIIQTIRAFHILNIPALSLSLRNFAFDHDNVLKLHDVFVPLFELPSDIKYDKEIPSFSGAFETFAPDLFRPNGRMTLASDIYAFGLMLFELMTGNSIYKFSDFKDETEMYEKIKHGHCQKIVEESIQDKSGFMHPLLADMILKCLSFHKERRPKAENILVAVGQFIEMTSSSDGQPKSARRKTLDYEDNRDQKEPSDISFSAFVGLKYKKVQFEGKIDEKNWHYILPQGYTYKGELKNRVPHGKGTLEYLEEYKINGHFKDGHLEGSATITFSETKEVYNILFKDGYPQSGEISAPNLESTEIAFEASSWIPDKDYREKIQEGYDKINSTFWEELKLSDSKAYNDRTNGKRINSFIEWFNTTKIDHTKQAEVIDSLGNLYYFPKNIVYPVENNQIIIIKHNGLIDFSTKLINIEVSKSAIFSSNINNHELIFFEDKTPNLLKIALSCRQDEVTRYLFIGRKYVGSTFFDQFSKGVFFTKYNQYQLIQRGNKHYKSGIYMKEDSLYLGEVCNDLASGWGLEFSGKYKKYEGEYSNGRPEGRGVVFNDHGRPDFKGLFINGKPVYGTLIDDKRTYEGKFRILQKELPESSPSVIDRIDGEAFNRLKACKFDMKTIAMLHVSLDFEQNNLPNEVHEFEGTVHHLSPNIKELSGKFIIELRKFDGHIAMVYVDGSKFEGNLEDGVKKGYGKYSLFNGDVYEGEWDDKILHGIIKWSTRAHLDYSEGEYNKEKSHISPVGTFHRLLLKNGDAYEGEIDDWKPHGFGRIIKKEGKIIQGIFELGKQKGLGKLWFDKKRPDYYYQGSFLDEKFEGYGKIYQRGELIFEGLFKNGSAIFGKLPHPSNGYPGHYVGEVSLIYDEIRIKGHGKYIDDEHIIEAFFDDQHVAKEIAKIENIKEKTHYVGQVKQLQENGLGKKTFEGTESELKEYLGDWSAGKMFGIGEVLYNDSQKGISYAGEICNGKNGIGELKINNRLIYKGEFQDDHRTGKGMLFKDGILNLKGIYEKGRSIKIYATK